MSFDQARFSSVSFFFFFSSPVKDEPTGTASYNLHNTRRRYLINCAKKNHTTIVSSLCSPCSRQQATKEQSYFRCCKPYKYVSIRGGRRDKICSDKPLSRVFTKIFVFCFHTCLCSITKGRRRWVLWPVISCTFGHQSLIFSLSSS